MTKHPADGYCGVVTAGVAWRHNGAAFIAALPDQRIAHVWRGRCGVIWSAGFEAGLSPHGTVIETCSWLVRDARTRLRADAERRTRHA